MEDNEHNRVSSKEVFTIYKKFHIEGNPDKEKTLSSEARHYLALKKYFKSPKAFDLYSFLNEFIEHSYGKNFGRKALVLKELQGVLQKLEEYGLRLVKRPWRREFFTIKLYTTFFKHDIESTLPSAVKVLQLYGYKNVSQNIVKIDSPDSDRIMLVCFELFLSRVELDVLSEICSSIEDYTSDFTLRDVLKARRRTKGDVKETVKYFREENPEIIGVKRIKTDDMESGRKSRDKFEKSNTFPAEDEQTSRTGYDNGIITSQARTKRDTKYPPPPDNYLTSSVNGSAKVRHISSTVSVENFSDAELYGHDDASSSSQDNNIPMETQGGQPWSGTTYDSNAYVDMSAGNGNYYEMMDQYGADNGLPSCTTLPPPPGTYVYPTSDPGIPPPTYDQATQIPGNDWVMIDNKDSDGLSRNISAMNIGGNGHGLRTSSEVGIRGVYTHDLQRVKAASANSMDLANAYSNHSYYLTEPQGTSTKTRAAVSSLKDHTGEFKEIGSVSSERPVLNGSHKVYESPTTTSFSKGFDSRQPEKSVLYPIKTPEGYKSKTDFLKRNTSSHSPDILGTSKTTEQLQTPTVAEQHRKAYLTRSSPEELSSKRMSDLNIPTTTLPCVTSSYSKGSSTIVASYSPSSKTQSRMSTRSQAKEIAASKSIMSEPVQGTSKMAPTMVEQYNKEKCIVCSSKATHHCVICEKKSCKVCTNVVTRLPCESYKEHLLVEGCSTTSNEKADLVSSKDVCSFCGAKTASHDCIYCSKKACGTCQAVYTKDPCVLGSSALHHFVNQERQKLTSEKHETSSQKQITLSTKDNGPNPVPQVTGENYCDFCGLAANLICKPCLKTICNTCRYIYKQDLCTSTKREHQFENINEQSVNTNEASGKDSRSMWSCKRCTFLNSSSHRICAVCATSRGLDQVHLPKSGSRKCQNCTYANEEGATICKMCSCTVGLDNPESYI